MSKVIKQIWNWVSGILVAVVVLLAVALVGVRVVGLQPFAVLSGSMQPVYDVGDLIYVKSVDYRELEAGDVITYLLSEDTVSTHRVMGVVPDEEDPSVLRFRTKGDANEAEDGTLVHYKNIIGSPVFSIPKLGYVAAYVSSPPGLYVAVGCCALLILLVFLPDLFSKEEKESGGRYRGHYERLDER